MLHHVMDLAKKAGAKRTVIVAGYRSNLVTGAAKTFSSEAEIVVQQEQLGTGHAVKQAKDLLNNRDETFLFFMAILHLFNLRQFPK